MDSPVSLNSYKPALIQSNQGRKPAFLDTVIPASLLMAVVPREFENRFVRVEKEPYAFANPLGELLSDDGGDQFVDVLVPGTLAQETVGHCSTIGEIIEHIQIVGDDKQSDKDEMIRYLAEIAKRLPVPDLQEFSNYLSHLNPPIFVIFPRETAPKPVPISRIRSIAHRRMLTVIETAPDQAESASRSRRHRCTIL